MDGLGAAILWLLIMGVAAVPVIMMFAMIVGLGLAIEFDLSAEARAEFALLLCRSLPLHILRAGPVSMSDSFPYPTPIVWLSAFDMPDRPRFRHNKNPPTEEN